MRPDRFETPRPEGPVPNPAVSLVIPAYNEADRLSHTLDEYLPVLRGLTVPYEVIVVCDGTDDTPSVARKYSDAGVVCFEFGRKLGRGGAIFEGFKRAKYPVIAYADADASIPGPDLDLILRLSFAGAPAVIASRRLLPSLVVVPETPLRRFIGTAWHLLVRLLLGLRVKDAQCGLKAFSREVVDRVILPRVQLTNRTFEVGMLFHVQAAGIHLTEVPVHYVHDFRTRMPIGRAIPIMFLTLLGLFFVNVLMPRRLSTSPFLIRLNTRFASA